MVDIPGGLPQERQQVGGSVLVTR